MTLYKALDQMRKISEQKGSFSMVFMSYSASRETSHGIVRVDHARLKPRAKAANYENAEIIEEYIDINNGESKKFYQCTLMYFNGIKVNLS